MRAYKFLNAEFGLKSLRERRLKQSRINDLNDPFELRPYDLTDPAHRQAFLQTRDQIHEGRGVLCFSEDWKDPVMWAHYSEKHTGLCLGFEIPRILGDAEQDESSFVEYIVDPLFFPPNFLELEDGERYEIVRKILFTKFKHWQYEHEIRVWAPLQHEDNGLYFSEFDEKLKIVEVVIGARCKVAVSEIEKALGPAASLVRIVKAGAAYDRFEMVECSPLG
jgi:DUF2971 family protein